MINRLRILLNKKIPTGSLFRNVITLISGTTFAQVLLVLISPILTRLYDPEDFGLFTMFSSILAILAVVSCFRYELAIVLPKKDKDAANILASTVLICFIISMFVLIIIILLREQISILLGASELRIWLFFLPLSLLMTGLYQAFNYWNTRKRQFNRLATQQITQSLVTAATQVSFGLTGKMQAGGLIGGQVAGQVLSTGRLIWKTLGEEGKQIIEYLSFSNMKLNLIKYKNFPLYSLWSGLLNTSSVMMPPLLLGFYFTPTVVGLYSLGHRVLNLPMNLIGSAVAQAFYPHASEAYRNGELGRVTFDVYKNLISIGLVPILLISLIAPELFLFVFGDNWYEAGQYVRWIGLWIFFVFISSPLSNIYLILEKQRLGLIMDFLLFFCRLIVLIIGGLSGDALLTIALFGMIGALLWIINCIFILKLAGISLYIVLKQVIREFLKAIPYTLLPIISMIFFKDSFTLIFSAILSGVFFLIIKTLALRKYSRNFQ
ncbi:oligosaccharide flippase family protein [Bacillus sp. JJ1532]|uniref:lipopolysaccharide biosynthesis protein n=1 Tax=unclassified Bacillus (in: firmicutes) TaxID=185979 RepID=UPI0030002DAC